MAETTLIEQAFDTFDSDLLLKALELGENINSLDRFDEPLWEEALFDYMNSYDEKKKASWSSKRKRIKDFLVLAVANGLNLNTYIEDDRYKTFSFYTAVRFCCHRDLNFLQFLIDLGVDLNGVVADGYSALDELDENITAEEMCDCPEGAKWYYDASRLLIKNGAKSYRAMHPEYSDFVLKQGDQDEVRLEILASQLDCSSLEELSSERIIELRLDFVALIQSKFYYPHEFYAHTKAFQQRIIKFLKKIMDKIGKDSMWDGLVEACIELQYLDVIVFLLESGIDPNINCFNSHYSFVSSSALYTLKRRGYLIPREMEVQMEKILLDKGAILEKEGKHSSKDRIVPKIDYHYDADLHSRMIEVLNRAWINLDATELLQYLHEDFQYDSQCVFDWMNKEEYSRYITEKYATIKQTNSNIEVSIVGNQNVDGELLELLQDKQHAFLRIKCTEGKIFKMDMCMF